MCCTIAAWRARSLGVVEAAECSEAKRGDEVLEACEEEEVEDIVEKIRRGGTKKDGWW